MTNTSANLDELINSNLTWYISDYQFKELPPKRKGGVFNRKREHPGSFENLPNYFQRIINQAESIKEGGGHVVVYYGSIVLDFVEKESNNYSHRYLMYRNWYTSESFDNQSAVLELRKVSKPTTIEIMD